jgi:hypothetical protein
LLVWRLYLAGSVFSLDLVDCLPRGDGAGLTSCFDFTTGLCSEAGGLESESRPGVLVGWTWVTTGADGIRLCRVLFDIGGLGMAIILVNYNSEKRKRKRLGSSRARRQSNGAYQGQKNEAKPRLEPT